MHLILSFQFVKGKKMTLKNCIGYTCVMKTVSYWTYRQKDFSIFENVTKIICNVTKIFISASICPAINCYKVRQKTWYVAFHQRKITHDCVYCSGIRLVILHYNLKIKLVYINILMFLDSNFEDIDLENLAFNSIPL